MLFVSTRLILVRNTHAHFCVDKRTRSQAPTPVLPPGYSCVWNLTEGPDVAGLVVVSSGSTEIDQAGRGKQRELTVLERKSQLFPGRTFHMEVESITNYDMGGMWTRTCSNQTGREVRIQARFFSISITLCGSYFQHVIVMSLSINILFRMYGGGQMYLIFIFLAIFCSLSVSRTCCESMPSFASHITTQVCSCDYTPVSGSIPHQDPSDWTFIGEQTMLVMHLIAY